MDKRHLIFLTPAALFASSSCYAVQYLTIEEAQKASFPEGKTFEQSEVTFTDQQKEKISEQSGVRVVSSFQKFWKVKGQSGEAIGYLLLDEVYGKHEFITYTVALDMEGQVQQVEILDYRETYGGEIRNDAWRAQFKGKKPGDAMEFNKDIKNISGATLSCRHISEGVKRLLVTFQEVVASHA